MEEGSTHGHVSFYTNIDCFDLSAMVKTTTLEVIPGAFYLEKFPYGATTFSFEIK